MTPRIANSTDPLVTRLRKYLDASDAAQQPVENVCPAIEAEIAGVLDYARGTDIPARELLVLELHARSRRPLVAAAINGFRDLPAGN